MLYMILILIAITMKLFEIDIALFRSMYILWMIILIFHDLENSE